MKKLFTLLTLLVCLCTGAWGTVTDLAFTATKTVTAGGEIWWTTSGTSGNVKAANDAGWCSKNENASTNKYGNITPNLSGDVTDTGNPANHVLDGVQVKGGNTPDNLTTSKKALVFKVTNTTAITAYGATVSSSVAAGLQWSIYRKTGETTWTAVATNAKGNAAATNYTCTISISGLSASDTYIVSIEGGYKGTAGSDVGSENQDVVVYAVKFAAPEAGKPTINTQPVSASYEVGDDVTALSVAATASSGDLSYQWYKNTSSASTEGATSIGGATSASYTPDVASEGTTYYYCAVSDSKGTTNSNFATISVVNFLPITISYESNTVTISYAGSGTVYYTTDNSAPTSSSSAYSAPLSLTNTSTVRVKVKKGENYSDEVSRNCYVDHTATAQAVLNYTDDSNVDEKVWTSTDGQYTLTASTKNISWATIFSTKDAFKMNTSDTYTLKVDPDVKVTSIKVIGLTRSDAANASTLTITNFEPASGTYEMGQFVKTIEFTPEAGKEPGYGDSFTLTAGGNQFHAYIEIYGVKRPSPADPQAVAGTPVTWDFSSSAAQTAAGSITASSSNSLKATDGTSTITYVAGSSDSYDSSNGYLKPNGKSGGTSPSYTDRYFCLNIAKSGKLSFVGGNTASKSGNYVILQGTSSTIGSATQKGTVANTVDDCSFSVDISNGEYVFVAFSSQIYTKSLSWTPATDDITLTTTANMAGWRAFYDADNGYTVDNNTKIYIVTAKDGTKATLTKVTGRIPAQTPVLLKTSADNRTMTLTKATSGTDIDATGNKLTVTDGTAVSNVYRLGYNSTDGVGFYPYSATSPASGIVYLSGTGTAKALTLAFSDVTGIGGVSAKKAVNTGKRYNLSGQLVGEDYKGIVIENGKKYIK